MERTTWEICNDMEDNIKTDGRETGLDGVEWIRVYQYWVQ
jgi:hypothetical protein